MPAKSKEDELTFDPRIKINILDILYGTPKWTQKAQDQEDKRNKLLFRIEMAKIGYIEEIKQNASKI